MSGAVIAMTGATVRGIGRGEDRKQHEGGQWRRRERILDRVAAADIQGEVEKPELWMTYVAL